MAYDPAEGLCLIVLCYRKMIVTGSSLDYLASVDVAQHQRYLLIGSPL